MSDRILIVEDEAVLRINLCELLAQGGYDVTGVATAEEGLERVRAEDVPVVITDIRLPGMDGIALLRRIVAERPETRVLLTTAYASVESAVDALRLGADDYLLKPVVFEDLLQKVRNLLEYRALREELLRLRQDIQVRLGFEGIVGNSPAIQRVFELIETVAPTPSTVLITGESGTGKELVARAVHRRSERADRPFIAVNIPAIPASLAEAQLFGHERGAYTGANVRREGLLRSARGGTIFLDEIGDLDLAAQARLLRATESREFIPLGGERAVTADFRLVAATNVDLEAAVEAGRFRRDLFFRLNVFRVALPPLRERKEDVPALVRHFARQHGVALGRMPKGVSNDAMRRLLAYEWPGNVRELSNIIERAVLLARGACLEAAHLPADLADQPPALTLRSAVEEAERRHIAWVLAAAGGSRDKAAALLEIDRATLYRRLDKYDIR